VNSGLDAGINWIDTAETYGSQKSEEVIGLALAGRPDSALIATKLAPKPWGSGFRSKEVRRGCEASLRRLGLERIDLYQLHLPDTSGVPLEETWTAMGELVTAGLVREIGLSNFSVAGVESCHAIHRVASVQLHFSMAFMQHRDLIQWCSARGIGILVYGSLGYGLLTGKITRATRFDERDWRSGAGRDELYTAVFEPPKAVPTLNMVDRLRGIAEGAQISLPTLVLGWTLAQDGVTAAIVGTRDERHARENAEAGDATLADDVLAEVDAAVENRAAEVRRNAQ
jgi:aryl-alcohol dehydrogenase-like predicted oxidoreductase